MYHSWELLYEFANFGMFSDHGREALNGIAKTIKRKNTAFGQPRSIVVQVINRLRCRSGTMVLENEPSKDHCSRDLLEV